MRATTRLVTAAVLLSSLVLLVLTGGCSSNRRQANTEAGESAGNPSPTTSPEDKNAKFARLAANRGTRAELLAALVEKGDAAARDEKDLKHLRSRWAYTFASLFDPDNREVAGKLKALGGQVTRAESKDVEGANDAGMRFSIAMISGISGVNLQRLLGSFPKLTPEMQLVNLRMLLDDRLVGDLAYTPWQIGEGSSRSLLVFIKQPSISPNELRSTYGEPSAENMSDNTTTYGLIRFYGMDCIVFPLEKGAIPKALAVR